MLRQMAADRRAWIGGLTVLFFVVWLGPDMARGVKRGRDTHRIDQYAELIEKHAAATGLDEALVRAVVMAESSGNPNATSNRGADGLMQITPITEKDVLQRNPGWEGGDLFDAEYNLQIGTTYLAYLLERFDGDERLALTAYHMGPTAVRRIQRKHAGITSTQLVEQHTGPQTRAYVARVMRER